MILSYLAMLAGYNRWANRRLYGAARALGDADLRADRGAFFGSVLGTLNHLLVADRIWMRRFTGEGPSPTALDTIVHAELEELAAARAAEDERIVGYVAGLGEADLARTISFVPITNPVPVSQPLGPALLHVLNHQTHHRGQVHCLLTATGGRSAAPALDLLLFQRESSATSSGA